MLEAVEERIEEALDLLLARGGDGGHGPAVERFGGGDDLIPLRPYFSRLYFRASLMAASLASAPLLQKNALSAKEWEQRISASSICDGMW